MVMFFFSLLLRHVHHLLGCRFFSQISQFGTRFFKIDEMRFRVCLPGLRALEIDSYHLMFCCFLLLIKVRSRANFLPRNISNYISTLSCSKGRSTRLMFAFLACECSKVPCHTPCAVSFRGSWGCITSGVASGVDFPCLYLKYFLTLEQFKLCPCSGLQMLKNKSRTTDVFFSLLLTENLYHLPGPTSLSAQMFQITPSYQEFMNHTAMPVFGVWVLKMISKWRMFGYSLVLRIC